MAIIVQCDECGKKYRLRDDLAGTEIPCKECGAAIWVEDEFDDRPPRRSARGGPRRRRPAPSRSQRRRNHTANNPKTALWIALGLGGVVIAGGIIALVIALGGDDDEKDQPNDQVASNSTKTPPQPNNANRVRNKQPGRPGFPPVFPGANNNNNNIKPAPNPIEIPPDNPNLKPEVVPPNNNNVAANGNGFQGNPQPLPKVDPNPGLQPGGDVLNIRNVDKPEVWKVTVDPPAEPVEITKEGEFTIKMPDAQSSDRTAMYPTGYSTIVALGDNSSDRARREIWNYATGKKLNALGGVRLWGSTYALSPDGRYLAVILHGADSKGPRVIDLEESKDLGQLPLADRLSFINFLHFPSADRLVAQMGSEPMKSWKIPSGEFERDVAMPERFEKESIAYSPGGRYMAVTETKDNKLHVIELETGATVGITPMPTSSDGSSYRCIGMQFTRDGTKLAGLFDIGSVSRILSWDITNGEVNDNFRFDQRVSALIEGAYSYKGAKLEWFPNGKRYLLYGTAIFDRDAGRIVWSIPKTNVDLPRRIIDDSRVLAGVELKGKRVMTTYTLPEEQIAKANEVIDQGGTLEDAGLPTLTKADRDSVQTVPLDVAGGAWQVAADPAPPAAEPLLDGAMPLRSSTGNLTTMFMTPANVARAVLMYTSAPNPRAGTPQKVWLESYDVAKKEHAGSLKVPIPSDLLAVSPSGQLAMMRMAGTGERVDIWKFENEEHYVAWRPYHDTEKGKQAVRAVGRRSGQTDQTVTAATFLDETHVVTLNRKNELVMWELPTCKAIYRIENAGKPGISPGGKFLVVSNGKQFRFFNSLTGQPAGDLPLEGALQAASYHPDGKQFGVVMIGGTGTHFVCWDLEKGQVRTEFPIPLSAQSMQWVGQDYLLLDKGMMIDLRNKLAAWKYQLQQGVIAPMSPNESVWYVTRTGVSGAMSLVSAALPEQEVRDFLEKDEDISPDYVVRPSSKLSVMINLADPAGYPDFRAKLYRHIIDAYAQHDITVEKNQRVTVEFTMNRAATGETKEFRGIGIGSPDFSISIEKVVTGITIKRDGQQVWERKFTHTNGGGFMVHLPPNRNPQEYLTEQMWKSATGALLGFQPPAYVFGPTAKDGLGRSTLGVRGVTTIGK